MEGKKKTVIALGAGKVKPTNKILYKNIDYFIPVNTAHLCIAKGISTFLDLGQKNRRTAWGMGI